MLTLWLPTRFDGEPELRRARDAADAIRPLFERKGRPEKGEWLYHFDELGQTLNQYVRDFTAESRDPRGPILVLPLGEFDAEQQRIVSDVARLTEIFYGRTVRLLPVEAVPLAEQQRRGRQLFTGPLLDWLKARVPADAAALLGMTSQDLVPEEPGWLFVFGMASLVDRVGVWSLYRLAERKAPFETRLRRVAQTALHELGHMFGIWHCTAYGCCMNGANTLKESDEAPLAFCAECDTKVLWRFRLDPGPRYARLAKFAAERGLARDAQLWERCSRTIRHRG
jgi:archaemetzincin